MELPKLHRNYSSGAMVWGSVQPDEKITLLLNNIDMYNYTAVQPPFDLTWHIMFSKPKWNIFFLFFISWFFGFCLNKSWENNHNKPVLGVISVRKKKHSEQRMKVHMVKYYSISNSFKCDWWEKENYFGEKAKQKS